MTTLETLIDQVEADLGDSGNTVWAAADIEQWLRDGIADYSDYFPRILTDEITTSEDVREYDLTADFSAVISVEYPTGEEPPVYLKRRPYTDSDFWNEDRCYDILPRGDDTAENVLYISTKPADSETITVLYQAVHDNSIATSGTLTVPARHHYILRAYARWKATEQRAAAEEGDPTSNSSLLMSQLQTNARRWKSEYLNALAKAIQAGLGQSRVVSWANTAEETKRIY
ncbi:MAG: hypothetical protein WAM60_20400 [Candidatus Promineifilaceae bacterium]